MQQPRSSKLQHSLSWSNNYSQCVRDGASIATWTPQHEREMERAGLFMSLYGSQNRATVSEDSKSICKIILNADYPLPAGPSFSKKRLLHVLGLAHARNEARVFRDITPTIVPSPELLHIDGCPGLEHICEAMDAAWTQCNTLCGPTPRPDMVVGISPTAFTIDEEAKLEVNYSSACPDYFPEYMYYPFLVCEVQSSGRPIRDAERHTMHSASMAVSAIIELYRKASALNEINREILVFSITHNSAVVKIFGHFALIEDDGKPTFFRHEVYDSSIIADYEFDGGAKAFKITRGIYEYFFPKHLARIRAGLSRLNGIEEVPQEFAANLSSQMDRKF